jgi:hypothetical protein
VSRAAAGIPVLWLLVLIFAAAKVFGFSNMPWLVVFAPVLIPTGLALVLMVVCLVGLGICLLAEAATK